MFIRLASPILLATAALATSSWSFLPRDVTENPRGDTTVEAEYTNTELFEDALGALRVMQDAYFEPWVGTWPRAIDWTAAVMGSHVAGALVSLSRGLTETYKDNLEEYRARENQISFYFSQLVAFYFGQNALSLRHQAYDDMLWVVLNWLDAIQFISEFSSTHPLALDRIPEGLQNQSWHGNLWTPAFAHRARIFWELAANGWDETLCGGGMFWNPRLGPYKNAITNELFISASASMFRYFPGDTNSSPFDFNCPESYDHGPYKSPEWYPHDPRYLRAAVRGYTWLMASNMTNDQGLFADGFHMSNYPGNDSKCDRRDEMVYTYNQGVILSGQLELFRTTGRVSFLKEGHQLIQNVIRATGWDLARDVPVDNLGDLSPGELPPWHGLGRAGILEEVCDPTGKCSQNSHTFKGIWMHHFTAFCSPLKPLTVPSDDGHGDVSVGSVTRYHVEACQKYTGFIKHNALAARRTRDAKGKFGMWWTVGLLNITVENLKFEHGDIPDLDDANAVDYRTFGVPDDPMWLGIDSPPPEPEKEGLENEDVDLSDSQPAQYLIGNIQKRGSVPGGDKFAGSSSDPNTRGRGRTVETQGGGLAVLRALWELSNQK